jgi:hypothetical protein
MTTRHGWPDPGRVFWQGAPPWGPLPYGHGGKTIGQWGCTAASLSQAQRLSGVRAGATPGTVVTDALRASPAVWAPGSSLAVLPHLARSAYFQCPDTEEAWDARKGMKPRELSIAICDAIDRHGLAPRHGFGWLHVDYTGDDVGEHWILAYAYDDDVIYCTDSAPAKIVELDRRTLKGRAKWGSVWRDYTVVRGYPLTV